MCYFTGVYYNIVSVEILDPIWKMRKLLAQLLNSKYVYWCHTVDGSEIPKQPPVMV